MEEMRLFHVTSMDKGKQKVLIPRIPDISEVDEDVTTKRISLAPTIKECISGIGNAELWNDEQFIRVYTLNIAGDDTNLVGWETLYETGKVKDAPLTHEHWYKEPIVPESYCEYRVDNIKTKSHFLVKASEKMRIIDIITELGVSIPNRIKSKTAVEILDYYGSSDLIEGIKSRLVHKERVSDLDEKGIENYKRIFGKEPEQFEDIQDYCEWKYVDDCRLTMIS